MSTKHRLLPAIIMLVAGAVTSIMTYILQYDSTASLWLLLCVLVVFYILGLILRGILIMFETQIEAEEAAKALEEEGKIVEKEDPDGADVLPEDMEMSGENADADASDTDADHMGDYMGQFEQALNRYEEDTLH